MTKQTSVGEFDIYLDSRAESGDAFYLTMGRHFANSAIRKELGEPMNDGDNFLWFLAFTKRRKALAGFAALIFRTPAEAWLSYAYVFQPHRRKGLHRALFEVRQRIAGDRGATVLRGVANPIARRLFDSHGFEVASVRGRYHWYTKELS